MLPVQDGSAHVVHLCRERPEGIQDGRMVFRSDVVEHTLDGASRLLKECAHLLEPLGRAHACRACILWVDFSGYPAVACESGQNACQRGRCNSGFVGQMLWRTISFAIYNIQHVEVTWFDSCRRRDSLIGSTKLDSQDTKGVYEIAGNEVGIPLLGSSCDVRYAWTRTCGLIAACRRHVYKIVREP